MFELQHQWDVPCRPFTGESRHDLFVSLVWQGGAVRAPLTVCVLVDCSFSMAGPKLAAAREAVLTVWDSLDQRDQFLLVPFSSRVRRPFSARARDVSARSHLALELRQLSARGVTRTDMALDAAEKLLAADGSRQESRLVLLVTDGNPTDGDGNDLRDTQWSRFYEQAGRLASSGVRLTAIGLGDARAYHRPFLITLAQHGNGSFVPAADGAALIQILREQVLIALATEEVKVELTIVAQRAEIALCDAFQVQQRRRLGLSNPTPTTWKLVDGTATAGTQGQGARFLLGFQVAAPTSPAAGDVAVVRLHATWSGGDAPCNGRLETRIPLRFSALAADLQRSNAEITRLRRDLSRLTRPNLSEFLPAAQPDKVAPTPPHDSKSAGAASRSASPAAATREHTAWALKVVRGRYPGQRYHLSANPLVFGNRYTSSAGIDFDLAEQTDVGEISQVSPRHFEMSWDGAEFWIRDLESKFGTQVNGNTISAEAPMRVAPRSVIRVCGIELQLIDIAGEPLSNP